MTTKIQQAAISAKNDGYEFMTSVVKNVFRTTYYHVVPIDRIIETGEWEPAPVGQFPTADGQSSWHGRVGQSTLPAKSINKSRAISRYCK